MIHKIITLFLVLAFTSCAALSTTVSKRKLEVKTTMQNSIFLKPSDNAKTIFVQIRNTSEQQSFDIATSLKTQLKNKGYQIVNNIGQAGYVLQINILQAGKTSKTALEKSPFGVLDAVGFGAAGAMIGSRNGNIGGTIVGGIIGAGASVVANSLVEDVYYSVITDVRINDGQNKYQTRILSSANKMNLKWEESQAELEKGLTVSIVGIF